MIIEVHANDNRCLRAIMVLVSIALMHGCNRSDHPVAAQALVTSAAAATTKPAVATDPALVALGRQLFFDSSLSASGRQSCASCHSQDHAYGPPNSLAVQMGGPNLDRQGMRAVPSLRYVLNRTPVWSKAFVSSMAERALEADEPPVGGFG